MKHFKWPRPPLVLGFILGSILERYMFISIERYGVDWMLRPLVLVLFALAALSLFRPLLQDVRRITASSAMLSDFGAPRFSVGNLFPAALLVLFLVMLSMLCHIGHSTAKIIPTIVALGAILSCGLSLANDVFSEAHGRLIGLAATRPWRRSQQKIHMDVATKTGHLPARRCCSAASLFFGWMVAFLMLHGADRPHPDRAALRRRLYAARRLGEVASCFPMAAVMTVAHLFRVRPVALDPMAADPARRRGSRRSRSSRACKQRDNER